MLPELVAVISLAVLLLITGHWILFTLYAPMAVWLSYKSVSSTSYHWQDYNVLFCLLRQYKIPKGSLGLYDATEIHNRGNLKSHIKDSIIRLCFHLVFFFIYLYCMIIALLTRT